MPEKHTLNKKCTSFYSFQRKIKYLYLAYHRFYNLTMWQPRPLSKSGDGLTYSLAPVLNSSQDAQLRSVS